VLSDRNNMLGPDWYRQPKVLLTFVAWVVYALVLHSPINPSFRGRKTALLSVVGFVLMIGVIVAVQLMPGSK
jgi:ABC-type transport system involved in cytochrome c biogenesis permease subunit